MLQLNKSEAVNTIAFYPNELTTGSAILLEFTQSYSNTVTGSFQADIISDPQTTPYIIAQFSGSLLPSASGQYDFKIFDFTTWRCLIWNTTNTQWQLTNTIGMQVLQLNWRSNQCRKSNNFRQRRHTYNRVCITE
jgi:hypothetical protein